MACLYHNVNSVFKGNAISPELLIGIYVVFRMTRLILAFCRFYNDCKMIAHEAFWCQMLFLRGRNTSDFWCTGNTIFGKYMVTFLKIMHPATYNLRFLHGTSKPFLKAD